MGTAISCRKYSQTAGLIHKIGRSSSKVVASPCAAVFVALSTRVIRRWELLPYSGKFSRGPNFRDFRDPRPKRENMNRENLNT